MNISSVIHCPNCLKETGKTRICSHCNYQLSAIMPLVEASRSYFQLALRASRQKDYTAASEHLQAALGAFPYLLEQLRFGLLFFHFTGNFEKSFECLRMIDKLRHKHSLSNYHEILRKSVDRYNTILTLVKGQRFKEAVQQHFDSLEVLSIKELELLRLAAENSGIKSLQKIDEVLLERSPGLFENESRNIFQSASVLPKRYRLAILSAITISFFLLCIAGFQYHKASRNAHLAREYSTKADSLNTSVISLNAQNDQLQISLKQSKKITLLIKKMETFARHTEHDSVWSYFERISKINPTVTLQHWQFLERTAKHFYVNGIHLFQSRNYQAAARFYYRSYKIAPDYWRSPHALSRACFSIKNSKGNGELFLTYLREFVQNYSRFTKLNDWDSRYDSLFSTYLNTLFIDLNQNTPGAQDSLKLWLGDNLESISVIKVIRETSLIEN